MENQEVGVSRHALWHVNIVSKTAYNKLEEMDFQDPSKRREALFDAVCEYVERKEGVVKDFAERVKLSTTSQVFAAVDEHLSLYEFKRGDESASYGGIMLVKEILGDLTEAKKKTREQLLEEVCSKLEDRYASNRLEQHLRQMNLSSVSQINKTIEYVLYSA